VEVLSKPRNLDVRYVPRPEETILSTLIFLAIALLCGVLFEKSLKGIFMPAVLAGVTTSALFHLVGYLVEGRFDALVMISAITVAGAAFLMALVIGAIMQRAGTKVRIQP
jgi:predicted PurR-regulated permease PerM